MRADRQTERHTEPMIANLALLQATEAVDVVDPFRPFSTSARLSSAERAIYSWW